MSCYHHLILTAGCSLAPTAASLSQQNTDIRFPCASILKSSEAVCVELLKLTTELNDLPLSCEENIFCVDMLLAAASDPMLFEQYHLLTEQIPY